MFEIEWKEHLGYEDLKDVNFEAKLHKHYGSTKTDSIFILYLISIIVWTLIIAFLQPKVPFLGWLILAVPFIFYFIAMFSISCLSRFVEEEMYDSNFTSSMLLIAISLIAFLIKGMHDSVTTEVSAALLIGTALLIFSMIDIWVSEKWLSLTVHFRSILQTASITIVIYCLYFYYYHTHVRGLKPS